MNCETCGERLIAWLDGETVAGVDEHLAACAACRGLFETARSTAQMLSKATSPIPRSTFEDLGRRPRWRWPAAVAAAAAIAVTGFFATRREDQPPRKIRIEVVDATDRVEAAQVEAMIDSMEAR